MSATDYQPRNIGVVQAGDDYSPRNIGVVQVVEVEDEPEPPTANIAAIMQTMNNRATGAGHGIG